MKKLFNLQLIIVFTAICLSLHAQDSVKKTLPAKKAATKPAINTKYKTYKYKPGYQYPKYPAKKPAGPALATTSAKTGDTLKAIAPVKPDAPTDKSLNGQYQYLLSKMYNYQQPLIGAFHKSIMDTLIQARRGLKDAQNKSLAQNHVIDSLKAGLKTSDATLSESNARVNEVSLLGMPVTKTAYNLIMWGLVIVFGATAAIVIGRSGAARHEAKYRTQLYNELEEEYKNYKAKAAEKEKKLARELQTERNKLDELLGK